MADRGLVGGRAEWEEKKEDELKMLTTTPQFITSRGFGEAAIKALFPPMWCRGSGGHSGVVGEM